MKSLKLLKKRVNGEQNNVSRENSDKALHKYSIYMQSRDSNWLNRNINDTPKDDDRLREEDIRE